MLAPSITTYSDLNPGFRAYDVVGGHLSNMHTWVLDLPKSNMLTRAMWFMEYDAVSAYGMQDMSAAAWHNLTVAMEERTFGANKSQPLTAQDLLGKYITHKYKSVETTKQQVAQCDTKCQKEILCQMRSAYNFKKCKFHKNSLGDSDVLLEPRREHANC